jgi:integrase
MAKENLTAERIAKAKCAPGKAQTLIWDAKAPGLALRITASEAKSYVFETKLHGKTIRLTIGDVRTWALDGPAGEALTARAEATRLKTMTDQGIDPRQEKIERRAKAERAAAESENKAKPAIEIWEIYVATRKTKWSAAHLEDHLKVVQTGGKKRTRGRRKGESDVTQPGALIGLLQRPLHQIDKDTVKAWLEIEAARRPTHARLCFGLLRAFLNWCADQKDYRQHTHADACAARIAKETLPKKAAKYDCLQREQLHAWFSEIRKLNPVQSAYLQSVLLTGPRRNELTALRWSNVDLQWNSLSIRDKVDGERTIPLTPYVKNLLLDLKARNGTPPPKHRILNGKKIENDLSKWKPSKFVFFSARAASGHIEEPLSALKRAVMAAGLPHLSIHGLRRSFGTLSEWVECPAGIVAQIQGHKPSATAEKHYRVRPLDLLRMWHTKIESWILEQAGIKLAVAE